MLNSCAYNYLIIGTALAYLELEFENHRRKTGGAIAGHGTSLLDPDDMVAKFVVAKCDEILKLAPAHELDPIPHNLEMLKATILTARKQKPHGLEIYTNDLLKELRKIKNDFTIVLSNRFFYYIQPGLSKYYGKPNLFGDAVVAKFPAAQADLESAGNCLALGEPTACVIHLNRAMEIALRRLARKLKIAVLATDSMGQVLGKMTEPIRNLPDRTSTQKRKKEKWAECRTNLYHVKMAWRDPGAHGTQSYTEKQAGDIFRRVQDFMQQLATLL